MHRSLVALCLAWLVSCAAPVAAEEEILRLPLTEKEIPAPRVCWYGIYINGAKVGHMREEFSRGGDGPEAPWVLDQKGSVRVGSMGKELHMELLERKEFDATAPFVLRTDLSRMSQEGGGEREIAIRRDASGVSAMVTDGGVVRTLPVPELEYTLADELTPERWVQGGPAKGDHCRVRSLKTSDLKVVPNLLTVLAKKESLVAGVRTLFYEVRQLSESDGKEGIARLDTHGQLLSVVFGGIMEARLEPEEEAKRLDAASDLFVFGIAAIDKPIGSPREVRKLVLRVDGKGAEKLVAGPGQAVSRDGPGGEVTLTLGAGEGPDDAATAAEIEASLKETVDCPCSMPEVKALATKAVGDAKTPKEKVVRLLHFVSEYVEDDAHPGHASVPEIIASKRGDCTEHALLFKALARAVGIPARKASGLMYMGDDVKAFGGHAWDEVVLEGHWVPVDPTWDESALDATHVTLDREDKTEGSIATMGRLQFRLVEEERAK